MMKYIHNLQKLKTSQKNIKRILLIIHKLHKNGNNTSSGEGIILTLKDVNNSQVQEYDLLAIVNQLKFEGAKAISINGQRIVNTTSIISIENTMLVNNKRITNPFIIKAIGSKDLLNNSMQNGYLYNLKNEGISVDYEKLDTITIEEYK